MRPLRSKETNQHTLYPIHSGQSPNPTRIPLVTPPKCTAKKKIEVRDKKGRRNEVSNIPLLALSGWLGDLHLLLLGQYSKKRKILSSETYWQG